MPSLADVYEAAAQFRDAQPWKWMEDRDIFAVQSPVSGKIGYCCIMGNANIVYALGIYDGLAGLKSYFALAGTIDETDIDKIKVGLEQNMYKVDFENREAITPDDKKVYKKLGLKFRGKNQWIQVHRLLPGYYPYTVEDEDLDLICYALQQSLRVLDQFKENPGILRDRERDILLRFPSQEADGHVVWDEKYIPVPEEALGFDDEVYEEVDEALVKKATSSLEPRKATICFTLRYLTSPLEDKETEPHPFFAQIGIWMAYGSAYILGFQTFSPKSFLQGFQQHFFEQLHRLEFIPHQIIVDSYFAAEAIDPMADALGIEVILEPDLEDFQILEQQFFKGFMGGMA